MPYSELPNRFYWLLNPVWTCISPILWIHSAEFLRQRYKTRSRTPPILTGSASTQAVIWVLRGFRGLGDYWYSLSISSYLRSFSLLSNPSRLIGGNESSPEVVRPSRPDFSHSVSFISIIHRDPADRYPSNIREQCQMDLVTTDGRQGSKARSSTLSSFHFLLLKVTLKTGTPHMFWEENSVIVILEFMGGKRTKG